MFVQLPPRDIQVSPRTLQRIEMPSTRRYQAALGGPIALLEDGDTIVIDAQMKQINVDVNEQEMTRRRDNWRRPPSAVQRGALAKYRAEVSSASRGAVTIPPDWDE